ncbi:hypothetical protein [Streptomyces sp. NPDC003832]
MRHHEKVKRVTDYRMVDNGKYVIFEIDYETAGGVKKTLHLAHCDADRLRVAVAGEYEAMDPEKRKRSFFASLRRPR